MALEKREEARSPVSHVANQVLDAEVFAVVLVDELDGRFHHLRSWGDERLSQDGDGMEENAAAEAADMSLLGGGERLCPLEVTREFADGALKARVQSKGDSRPL